MLPLEIIELQLQTLDVLESMFPELQLQAPQDEELKALKSQVEEGTITKSLPQELRFILQVSLEGPPEGRVLEIGGRLPLSFEAGKPDLPPLITLSIRPPSFISRTQYQSLVDSIPPPPPFDQSDYYSYSTDTLLQLAEFLKEIGPTLVKVEIQKKVPLLRQRDDRCDRVWFWFMSLSTREKRDDLVNFAPQWKLTGFVLAGKPGIMCLEGHPTDVNDYMAFIKAESWADIPSYQKKVSERYRETDITERKFDSMVEITSMIEQHGARGNRGDMGAVKAYLESKGVGESFGLVVGTENQSSSS